MVDTNMIDALAFYRQYVTLADRNGKRSRNWRTGEMEYHGSCPWCGGTDRFLFTDTGRYSCKIRSSGCGRFGSSPYWFLRDYAGLNHWEACNQLHIDPGSIPARRERMLSADPSAPGKAWQERAAMVIERAQHILWSQKGKLGLDYLHHRGFTDETIRTARLGYIPVSKSGHWFQDPLETWGLLGEDAADDRVWLPEGILIPWFADGKIWKLNVRRLSGLRNGDAKYLPIAGSREGLYHAAAIGIDMPLVLCESELDALSGMQEAGNMAAFVATGSTTRGRRNIWYARLCLSSRVLVAFDADETDQQGKRAGDTGAQHWIEILPHAMQWLPWAHDINDMVREGLDLQEWVRLGLSTYALWEKMEKQQTTLVSSPAVAVSEGVDPDAGEDFPIHCSVCGVSVEDAVDFFYAGDGIPFCNVHYVPETEQQSDTDISGDDAAVSEREQFMGSAARIASVFGPDCKVELHTPGYTLQDHCKRLYPDHKIYELGEYYPVTLPTLPRDNCPYEVCFIVTVKKQQHPRIKSCSGVPLEHGWCSEHQDAYTLLSLGAKLGYPRVQLNTYRAIGEGVASWEAYAQRAHPAWLKHDIPRLKNMVEQRQRACRVSK